MIARLYIRLPFVLSIPQDEVLSVLKYELCDFSICIYPPIRSESADRDAGTDSISINGIPAYNADTLLIDFRKVAFDRTKKSGALPHDPPGELVHEVLNNFLLRLRYVTGSKSIKLIDFPLTDWNLTYLDDSGNPLAEDRDLFGAIGSRRLSVSYNPLNKEIWNNLESIYPNYALPSWKILLIDAEALLPEIGPAIVLTFTALEVFITKTLNDIAATGKINDELWEWINKRESQYMKEPSISEKFHFLAQHLIGTSIKNDKELGKSFKDLKDARNSFVHEGTAIVNKKPVTEQYTLHLMRQAHKIIEFHKEHIPEQLRWADYKYNIKISFSKDITKAIRKEHKDEPK